MRKLKQWVSLLLAAVMAMSLIAVPAMAAPAYEGDHNGSVTVTARDAVTNDALKGVRFKLEDLTAGRYQTFDTLTTDKSGQVTWSNLSSGQYRVTQVSVPDNYELDTNAKSFWLDTEVTGSRSLEFLNRAEAALHIYRFDPDPTTGFKPLAGATFKVEDSTGKEVARGATEASGFYTVPNLPDGEYLITELSPPTGYNLSQGSRRITINSNGVDPYVVEFSGAEKSSITIIARDNSTLEGIPGTVWKVEETGQGAALGNTYEDLVTNSAGVAYVGNLEPGTYIISQTSVAKGYMQRLETATVTITAHDDHIVQTLYNVPLGGIEVYVADSVEGGPLAGAKFTLYDSGNQVVQGPVSADTDGMVRFSDIPDGNYTVVATAPSGYVMDVTSVVVSVAGGSVERVPFTATQKGTILIYSIDASNPSEPIPGVGYKVTKMDGTVVGTFTTGVDGTAKVTALDSGYYIIEQTGLPDGFVQVSATRLVEVTVGKVSEAIFYNRAKPYIIVETVIAGTSTPIAGSTVALVNERGEEVRRGTTGNDGQVTFEDVDPGTYTAKYAYAPDGYTIEAASQTVVVTTSKAGQATLTAERHSSIVITKMDSQNQQRLPGATFQIRDYLGVPVAVVTTGLDGTAATPVLDPGRYTIHEMFAPDQFVPETEGRTVTVRNNETTNEIFTNTKKSAIVVYAYDRSGTPLANVPFIVTRASTGKEVAHILTNAAGVATTDILDPGQYTVTCTTVPADYTLVNPTQAHIVLTEGEPTYVRFVHVAKSSIKMETVDINTGEPITGAVYQITSADGDFEANYTVDANGEAFTEQLKTGKYYVKQIVAPDGYLLNTTTQTINVTRDQENLAKFFNKQMSRIVIQATVQGSDFGLSECSFTVEDSSGKQVFHGTTDDSGTLTTGDLTPGRYTVKQIAAKDGYEIVQRERTVDVTLYHATTVKFEQVPKTCIVIQLTDRAEPLKGIQGATFQVETISGEFVTELVTDESGLCITGTLSPGQYVVHQTSTAAGYLLSQTYQWATVSAGQNTKLEFTNAKVSGLIIQCLSEGDHRGLAGGVFEIYHENGKLVKTVTSDSTGVINVTDLSPDIYLIKQVTVPAGYTARTSSMKVAVTTDEATTATFYHTSEADLTVNLTDAQTGAPLADGVFRVYHANGDLVGEYRTNTSGQFVISTLAAGTYTVEMVSCPDGYVADLLPRYVTVKDNQPAVLDIAISAIKGLQIRNTCTQDGAPIAGNTFKITTYEGVLVGNYTTNTAGLINVTLEPGTYTVYQTFVADGYVKNDDVWNITIKAGVQSVLEVQNEKESSIVIHVVDSRSGKGIYNVSLEIKDEGNNFIGRFTTDNNGNVFLTDVLKAGRYTVHILNAPEGYYLDGVPKTFVVETGETTEVTLKLDGQQGQLTIVTYAGEDSVMMQVRKNTKIAGAVYTITDLSGTVVATIQGDSSGEAHSGALPVGTYYIQQVTPPNGFQLNNAKLTVNVTSKNDNLRIEVFNKAAYYNMTISAHGQTTAIAGGTVKYYFTDIANNSTSAMDNFFISIKIPTDCMRASTFYTGTYNYQTYYNVEYRTNLRDWRTLATGCSSKSNYNYDLSTRSMGLGVNEYVTDVRLVFPNVISGFKGSMAPTLYCHVLSAVPTGYQAVLRCEVGGQTAATGAWTSNGWSTGANSGGWNTGASAGGWNSGASSITTYIYGVSIPGTLPKTGY